MPQVRYAPNAIRDLQRLRKFLLPKNPVAAKRFGEIVMKSVEMLGQQPLMGRPIENMLHKFREWLISFGDSGYVVRYRLDGDEITILAVRHQKEAGHQSDVTTEPINFRLIEPA